MQIRQTTSADASAIAHLNRGVQQVHADAYPWMFKQPDAGSYSAAEARTLMARADFISFIAEIEEQSVGYAIAEEKRRPETGRHYARRMIFIHEICVAHDARRRGVGRGLIAAVQDYGRSVGIELLALDTWDFNTSAQAFFRSCGLAPARIMMWNRLDQP